MDEDTTRTSLASRNRSRKPYPESSWAGPPRRPFPERLKWKTSKLARSIIRNLVDKVTCTTTGRSLTLSSAPSATRFRFHNNDVKTHRNAFDEPVLKFDAVAATPSGPELPRSRRTSSAAFARVCHFNLSLFYEKGMNSVLYPSSRYCVFSSVAMGSSPSRDNCDIWITYCGS